VPFDAWRYEREFLRPLRGRPDQVPHTVLAARYAVPESPTTAELSRHLAEVRAYWQSRAAGPDFYAELCRALLVEDGRMRETVGDPVMSSPQWWTRRTAPTTLTPSAGTACPPPGRLLATVSGAAVVLDWQEDPAAGDAVRYCVLRGDERVPAHPDDGVLVATTPDLQAVDAHPPVATPVHYAVFATSDYGQSWSAPATVRAVVLPPVTEVGHVRESGRITATWQSHPAAVGVRVRRTAGRPPVSADDGQPVPSSSTSFDDRNIRADADYFYSVVADYGGDLAPMVVVAVPGGTAPPAADLRLAVRLLSTRGQVARVRLTWPDAGDADVQVRRASHAPRWRTGSRIPLADLDRFGEEVVGQLSIQDGQRTLDADVPVGYHVYVPFAVRSDGALVGRSAAQGAAEAVSHLQARRIGDTVLLSWRWPQPTGFVEVSWDTPDGPVSQRVGRAQYDQDRGLRVSFGRAAGEIWVRALSETASGPVMSPAASVHIGASPVRLTYRLVDRRRHVTVELTADEDCADVRVLVVVSSGQALPARPAHGVVVEELDALSFAAGQARTFDVALPADLRRPGWMRCFDGETVAMVDPPIENLRLR